MKGWAGGSRAILDWDQAVREKSIWAITSNFPLWEKVARSAG
jgi:hypothetical protein